jgi:hypothetical protein
LSAGRPGRRSGHPNSAETDRDLAKAGPKGSKAPAWGTETFNSDPKDPGGFVEAYDDKGNMIQTFFDLTTSQSPTPPDTFCGPAAGSEKEVQAVTGLLAKGNFKCMISYHNFSQMLLYPDEAEKDDGVQFLGKGMESLLTDQKVTYKYESGSGLYPTSGDTMDWSYRESALPNYTIELPPTDADAKAKTWDFNKLPPSEIDSAWQTNLPAALCTINCAISGLKPGPMAAKKGPPVAKVVLDCWKVFLGWKP